MLAAKMRQDTGYLLRRAASQGGQGIFLLQLVTWGFPKIGDPSIVP